MNENDDLKGLFAPYRMNPRPGFADRVMTHLDDAAVQPARRGLFWFGFSAELAGATAALWLFLAALNLPEPDWFTQEQVLPQAQTAWMTDNRSTYPDWMEE